MTRPSFASRRHASGGRRPVAATLAAALALAAPVGCTYHRSHGWKFASWDVRNSMSLKRDKKAAPEVPVRLVSAWTEATHHRAGEKPTRGFGGRLAFFTNASENPVRVDGQLVVYAFDETSRADYETQPTRRYVFPADQFAVYESEGPLGPSYSVWLPWDAIGGPEQKISLIAKFEPTKGAPVVGEQTRHYLAGPPNPQRPPGAAPTQYAGAGAEVRSVSYETPATIDPLQTTTIGLPKHLSPEPDAQSRRAQAALRAAQLPPTRPVAAA
ncbi:MAG TPA: hypothetical protein PJ982_11705, partial [Lacipirellulaceae bacterium]|nr:hypothetical protein [Lacipirellulaceae bacterium]